MNLLPNGRKVCDCKTDNFVYRKCPVCGEEVERCTDCHEVKASDCVHYDPSDKAKAERVESEGRHTPTPCCERCDDLNEMYGAELDVFSAIRRLQRWVGKYVADGQHNWELAKKDLDFSYVAQENAAFIVRAVNNFDAMRSLLGYIEARLPDIVKNKDIDEAYDLWERVRSTIVNVEGKGE